mmetsp:Transcript_45861/g.82545  ORF Transcript_45861/g.82545 Transcript_45861/m.82545 type:complete len:379 (-) Transcript_45861:80-1216(-)
MPALGLDSPNFKFESENVVQRMGVLDTISLMLSWTLRKTMLAGFVVTLLVIVVFSFLFLLCGEGCFVYSDEFDYEAMFALSVHIYTTVGFGSVYPICITGQLLVVTEQYISVGVVSVLAALIVVQVMNPRATVRFAKYGLFSVTKEDDPCRLLVRLANTTRYPLEHCKAKFTCKLSRPPKGMPFPEVELPLMADTTAVLLPGSQWTLAHELVPDSPLEKVHDFDEDNDGKLSMEELEKAFPEIAWIDVQLSAFDTVYGSVVRFRHRYFLPDLISQAHFKDMIRTETRKTNADGKPGEVCFVTDHNLIDEYIREDGVRNSEYQHAPAADGSKSDTKQVQDDLDDQSLHGAQSPKGVSERVTPVPEPEMVGERSSRYLSV